MDNEQLNIFRTAFKQANYGNISMPKVVDVSKIYDIEIYPNGTRDGYKVRFRFTKDENNNYQLELVGNDDYSNWHKRIDHTGKITVLDAFKDIGVVYPEDPERTERERNEILNFNEGLQKLLIEKGLERDFENDEFEKANVIVLRKYHFDTQSF